MKSYPRLSEMGVRHPLQISSYSVNSIDYIDVLRITYDRPKGSKLPGARTYQVSARAEDSGGGRELRTSPPRSWKATRHFALSSKSYST